MAWALFAAYKTIVMQTIGKIKLFEAGIDNKELMKRDGNQQLVKAALPSYEAYIEENGEKCYPFLINILENNFLDEIRKMLLGEEDDKQTVERVAKIVEIVNELKANEKTKLK